MAKRFNYIPMDVITEDKRRKAANNWAQQQRAPLAQNWAQNAMSDFNKWMQKIGQQEIESEQMQQGDLGQMGEMLGQAERTVSKVIPSAIEYGRQMPPTSLEDVTPGTMEAPDRTMEDVTNIWETSNMTGLIPEGPARGVAGLIGETLKPEPRSPEEYAEQHPSGPETMGQKWERWQTEKENPLLESLNPIWMPGEYAQAGKLAVKGAKKAIPKLGEAAVGYKNLTQNIPIGLSIEDVSKKKFWEMGPDELDVAYDELKKAEQGIEESLFGTEGAKRYRQLQRRANSSSLFTGSDEARRIDDEIARMEDSLTDAQRDKLFGIGEADLSTLEDIRGIRNALGNLDFDSPEALGDSLKWAITKVKPGIDPSKMTVSEMEAYAQLRYGLQEAQARGWDTNAVSQAAIKGAASRFDDPNDAAYMLEQFMNKQEQGPKTTEPLQLGQGGIEQKVIPEAVMGKSRVSPKLPKGAKPIELTPEEEIARLRLDKEPEAIRDEIIDTAESAGYAHEARRGVIPIDVQEQAARELGATKSVDEWIKEHKLDKAYNETEIKAIRNAFNAQEVRMRELRTARREAVANGTMSDDLARQIFEEGEKAGQLFSVREGARATSGRSVASWKTPTTPVMGQGDAVARIYKKVGGRDNAEKLLDEFDTLIDQGASPIQMAQFWARVEKPPPGIEDYFKLLRYNSMLSGPRSAEINIIGSALEIPWRLARDTGASLLRGRPEEIGPELSGMWIGLQKGAKAYMEVVANGITTEQALRGDIPLSIANRMKQGSVGQKVATAFEIPLRLMNDELIIQTAYSMELGRMAAKEASKTGARGEAWKAKVADILANPSKPMIEQAYETAKRMAYQGEMGHAGEALKKVGQIPWMGNILVPFVKTVYNITARGIDRSPLGLLGTGIDVARGAYKGRKMPKGGVPLGERLPDAIIGSLATVGLTSYALQGNMSAAGPDDLQQKELLRAQGWQPYSVKIGDKWVSYANWGAMSVPFAMAASMGEASLYKKQGDNDLAVASDAFSRLSQLATEQTYLQGLGLFFKAIRDPERYGGSYITQFMQTLIPFGSAVNTIGQATDELQRKPAKYDIGQAMMARVPGLRQQLPAAQDVLGKPVENIQSGASALSPFRVSPVKNNTVLKALTSAKVDITTPPTSIEGVGITEKEQQVFQRIAGPMIETNVNKVLQSGEYRVGNLEKRQKLLRDAVQDAREEAKDNLVKGIGVLSWKQRSRTKAQ